MADDRRGPRAGHRTGEPGPKASAAWHYSPQAPGMMIADFSRARIYLGLLGCCLAGAVSAQAQTPAPPETIKSMPIPAGRFGFRPSLAITGVGSDSNVFNVADNPQDDFTATIVPRIVAPVRAARLPFSSGPARD